MITYLVQIQIKPEFSQEFINATAKNVNASRKEPGIIRFDLLQPADEQERFYLLEEYETSEAVTAHKQTAHYFEWRETVEKMMAIPRKGSMLKNIIE
ncbi:MAG: antibiotic biosynthesis monooxygenase [Anaerolineae bacterium]|nr:antibiotic biosynthesis monooxygenase [Anaerolineae bacterium]